MIKLIIRKHCAHCGGKVNYKDGAFFYYSTLEDAFYCSNKCIREHLGVKEAKTVNLELREMIHKFFGTYPTQSQQLQIQQFVNGTSSYGVRMSERQMVMVLKYLDRIGFTFMTHSLAPVAMYYKEAMDWYAENARMKKIAENYEVKPVKEIKIEKRQPKKNETRLVEINLDDI